jgi:hypothetical protein
MVLERVDHHSTGHECLLDFPISLDRHRLVIAIPVDSIGLDVRDETEHLLDLIPPAPLQGKSSSGQATGEFIETGDHERDTGRAELPNAQEGIVEYEEGNDVVAICAGGSECRLIL